MPPPDDSIDGHLPSHPFADLGGPGEPWWPRLRAAAGRHRWSPDRAVTRLVVVAAFAAVIGAGAVWAVGSGSSGVSGAAGGLPMATRRPGAAGSATGPATAVPRVPESSVGAPDTTIGAGWVAVAGAVVRPGLYRVPADTRVSSLITAAGGLTLEADPDRINLAAPVRDGERVYVPRRGEPGAPAVIAGTAGAGGGAGAVPAPGGEGAGGPKGPVNLNQASAEQLDGLPGVGPATARAILEHRRAHGPFTTVEQLAEVRGIGPAKLDQLRALVVV